MEAHKGAVLGALWSHDGNALITSMQNLKKSSEKLAGLGEIQRTSFYVWFSHACYSRLSFVQMERMGR